MKASAVGAAQEFFARASLHFVPESQNRAFCEQLARESPPYRAKNGLVGDPGPAAQGKLFSIIRERGTGAVGEKI